MSNPILKARVLELFDAEELAQAFAIILERRVTEINVREYNMVPSIEDAQANYVIALRFARFLIKMRLMKI